MRVKILACVLALCNAAAAGEPAKPPSAPAIDETLVLDRNAYWRHYFVYAPPKISAAKLKSEGEKYLGDKLFPRYKKVTEAMFKNEKGEPPADWTEKAILILSSTGFSFENLNVELMKWLRTPPPAADWMQPDFDDSDWVRQRLSYGIHSQVRGACLRTRFEVADPAQVRNLRLNASFRGGIRIFLNGHEIARGSLPQGELAATGEEYPAEAYHLLDGEYNEADYNRKDHYAQYWQKVNGYVLVHELPAFDKLEQRKDTPFRYAGNTCINQAGHERIQKIRSRTLENVSIDGKLLRKGVNLLAVELRASDIHPLGTQWTEAYVRDCRWTHGNLVGLELRADKGTLASTLRPLPGVQVWVEDMHRRIHAPDFYELSQSAHKARIAGARNGVFGAQLALRTDRELTGLKARLGPLLGPGGAVLPAEQARVLYGVPHLITELKIGDGGRRVGNSPDFGVFPEFITSRYGALNIPFFDHLSAAPPEKIPAQSGYAMWVSVQIPANANPGLYKSSVEVQADGLAAVSVPLEVEVSDWRIPDPRDFQTVMALEQSPYCVAAQYKVPLWSDAHFKLLEQIFSYLAQVDNDWLNIPVLMNTEFGNLTDSPLRVLRKKDGAYALDFTIMDRYIDLAVKHCGAPQVVNFIVQHPGNPGDGRMARSPMDILVLDEATGKSAPLGVDRRMPDKERREFWRFLANGIVEHMKTRGMQKATYWGYTWDGIGADPALYELLAEFQPTIFWTKGSHQGAADKFVKVPATAYNANVSIGFSSRKGWKRPDLWLAYPRYWGTIIDCSDYSPPFCYRLMPERAIASGGRGIGRVGVDYWGDPYMKGHVSTYPVGVPNLFVLWPGKDGPESGTRFEIFREGLQEVEARVFLEQALEKLDSAQNKELLESIQKMLDQRLAETLIDSPASSHPEKAEMCGKGWQTRSRLLYQAAADVAQKIGVDMERRQSVVPVPARGKTALAVPLRNWTPQPRGWKAAAGQAWIQAEKAEGSLPEGRQELRLTLDGSKLEPGKEAKGELTLTDSATGRTEKLEVTAQASPVFTLAGAQAVLNAAPGEKALQSVTLLNESGAELSWSAQASAPWVSLEPARGTLTADGLVTLTVSYAPPDKERARHELMLSFSETGGVKQEAKTVLHVVPPYQAAAGMPAGTAVPLSALPKEALKSYRDGRGGKTPPFHQPKPDQKFLIGKAKKEYASGFSSAVAHEAVYNVEGKNFAAFAAEVGPGSWLSDAIALDWAYTFQLHFEIYVDGKLAAHSGLMQMTDDPRLLCVKGLESAREVRLVTRAHNDASHKNLGGCWGNPAFYEASK